MNHETEEIPEEEIPEEDQIFCDNCGKIGDGRSYNPSPFHCGSSELLCNECIIDNLKKICLDQYETAQDADNEFGVFSVFVDGCETIRIGINKETGKMVSIQSDSNPDWFDCIVSFTKFNPDTDKYAEWNANNLRLLEEKFSEWALEAKSLDMFW